LKPWLKKLFEQLDVDWGPQGTEAQDVPPISDDRATLLFILDTYNKYLLDIDGHPMRKVRETLDDFSKLLLKTPEKDMGDVLFKLRQYLSSYRIDEYTFIQKTFDEFKSIIWDFADQLGEDLVIDKEKDIEISQNLGHLREAVESNSIHVLKSKAREFIDYYVEVQNQRDDRRSKRLLRVKKNLQVVKRKLVEANQSMRTDHLTKAYNRKSFDEQLKNHHSLFNISKNPVSLITLDIDFFKKINDAYGHDIGDFVLKECVVLLQEIFNRKEDFVARIGGEEFAVILPDSRVEDAVRMAEEAMAKIRREVFIQGELEIKFTVSMGIAQLLNGEKVDQWLKRADQALYQSKNTGRNKYTVATNPGKIESVA
jgi:diguanylate cyclase